MADITAIVKVKGPARVWSSPDLKPLHDVLTTTWRIWPEVKWTPPPKSRNRHSCLSHVSGHATLGGDGSIAPRIIAQTQQIAARIVTQTQQIAARIVTQTQQIAARIVAQT